MLPCSNAKNLTAATLTHGGRIYLIHTFLGKQWASNLTSFKKRQLWQIWCINCVAELHRLGRFVLKPCTFLLKVRLILQIMFFIMLFFLSCDLYASATYTPEKTTIINHINTKESKKKKKRKSIKAPKQWHERLSIHHPIRHLIF